MMEPQPSEKSPGRNLTDAALSRPFSELVGSMRGAQCSSELLRLTSEILSRSSSCKLLFHISIGNQGSEPLIETVLNRFGKLPTEATQWALNIALKAITTERLCIDSAHNNKQTKLIAAPYYSDQPNAQTLVAIFVDSSEDATQEIALMQLLTNAIESWHLQKRNQESRYLAIDLAAINEIQKQLDSARELKSCFQTYANELAQYVVSLDGKQRDATGCSVDETTVFIGASTASGLELRSVSNTDSLPRDTELVDYIESAMAECVCRNTESNWPPISGDRHSLLCHQRLQAKLQASAIFSLPLSDSSEENSAVVTIATPRELTDRQRNFLRASANSAADKLENAHRAERTRLEKLATAIPSSFRSKRGATLAKVIAFLILCSLIPTPYQVSSDCELRPTTRRFVCAPFASRLEKCFVAPGDTVAAGQSLGILDDSEIQLEYAENKAELSRAQKEHDGFLATHQTGEARLAQLEAEKITARNKLLLHQIDNLDLVSPVDGVVVAGDLEDAIGMPLSMGDSMFEIAPLDTFIVEVQIPEDDIRYIELGMGIHVRFAAIPFQSFRGTITRLHPESVIDEDENVFVAMSTLEKGAEQFRPGMKGTGTISTAWRPVAWNFLHKPCARCLRWLGW
ncbi:MAG: efflux RND transporter periplasmic adaptor subunit [Planctomycetota bacterium]